jgi:hypothetical protein
MAKSGKRKYRRGRRKCTFCGGFKISKEHVFPDWLKELFPRDADTTHTATHFDWPKNFITKVPIEKRKYRQGHVGAQKVRVVCERCNNGWLSALEEHTKPILLPLISGENCNLPLNSQTALATWAVKTSMTAEYLRPRDKGITQDERTWLMEYQVPPLNWFVWIATYDDETWQNLRIYQNRGRLDDTPVSDASRAKYYIQSTTFGIGHVLFLTISSTFPEIGDKFTGREVDGLIQIWPPRPRSIIWPLARVLADPQANAVANILSMTRIFDHTFDPGADWTATF